jgi:hypothetical protein
VLASSTEVKFPMVYLLDYFQWAISNGLFAGLFSMGYLLDYFQGVISNGLFAGLFSMGYFQWVIFNGLFSKVNLTNISQN